MEFTYNATLAGLSGQFSAVKYGLFLSASGYNDKMDTFIESLLTVGHENYHQVSEY
jgi:secreted Zn-dependent insulinase-like peptidase